MEKGLKQLQLVTFEQAKRLCELNFNLETDYHWNVKQRKLYECSKDNYNDSSYFYSAPTVALALKWMRDVKDIECGVDFFDVVSFAYQGVFQLPKSLKIGDKIFKARTSYYTLERHDTYEAAESELLNELLTILEKKK
jgi:hypothetical protein